MKPLPEAVQAAFPCAPDRLPSRPWWLSLGLKCYLHGELLWRKAFSRTDDRRAFEPTPRNLLSVEEVDAQHPLPHPHFRAGQVWAAEDGSSVTILSVVGRGGDRTPFPITTLGHKWSGSDFNKHYPYLMSDPACPHLAPWSPAEEPKP